MVRFFKTRKNIIQKKNGLKNYYDMNQDGRIINGIDKKCKTLCNRISRRRDKQTLEKCIKLDKEI